MNEIDVNQLAVSVAEHVTSQIDVAIACVGAGGVIVGALITSLFNIFSDHLKAKPKKKLDAQRKKLLLSMLKNPSHEWRSTDTLSSVIGTDHEEVRRLLIDIGARGSETDSGKWSLIERNPLP